MSIEQEVPRPQPKYPWQGRTPEQWRRLTTPQEAIRLFNLAQQKDNTTAIENPFWQIKWGLLEAYETFWKGNNNFEKDLKDSQKFTTRESPERFLAYKDSLDEIFNGPNANNVYTYLQAIRGVKVKEDRQKEKFQKATNEQPAYLVALSEFPKDQQSPVLSDIHRLIETFIPEAHLTEMNTSVNRSQDRQEGQSFTQLRLVEAATQFFWETYELNPDWTIQRFVATLRASLIEPQPSSVQQIFPRDDEEENEIEYFVDPTSTEEKGVANLGKNLIFDIAGQVADKKSALILHLNVIAGLTQSEIAKRLEMSDEAVAKSLRDLKEKLRNNETIQATYPHLLKTAKTEMQIKGDDVTTLFAQSGEIAALFHQNKHLLRPGDQEKIEALLAIVGQEAAISNNDLLAKIAHTLYPDVGPNTDEAKAKTATVRRSIARAINVLTRKEEYHQRPTQFKAQQQEQETQFMLSKITSDANFWESLSAREKEMMTQLYVNKKMQSQVATELNLNPSSISRFVTKVKRRFGI